ncbi:acetyl-CoA C-acetyltransferase [Campylobacter hepaticus]|uniref:Acetyl-CoA C-acetyltransferase n=1 Tax=Campylobacter hepaticus TaxID=1813019 RepID=A0A424Z186_9BACT|nr:acetyl-CoA C-acetyltransferase [Campylobacter hepaticus]AXP08783.1 acetyl-CoA C-acetyltransferase [Campylobacter hepaticus]MCZ0772634.1 acetyl-CoA C-acetyltransferase [Campylobacter hepaticus]MCZ0774102.1 acetyl-CoA C-acetyltransferase [Campylobacter hepaticus]MCZ0775354.1 acetyl-CoA C-acetyltransferase [Campylobacter hepaticus]MDX2330865.1 acetyl-CoA C-acetyltransferase [Campylobacter hepaticus]
MEEVVIVAAKRSAIGSFLGSLKMLKPVDMVSDLSKNLISNLNLDASLVEELILGQVLQVGQGQNIARQALLKSGLKEDKTAFLVNMVCGSGLKAVELGFNSISLNHSSLLLAGGVENMSLSPFIVEHTRLGCKMGNQTLIDTMIHDGLWCALNDYHMGITAENLAKKYQISRKEQDEFAFNSHKKASKAIEKGYFNDEILALNIKNKNNEVLFKEDEFVRKDISLEKLSKLPPVFDKEGSVSAGNSSGINDGAAMLMLASREKAKELALPILASIKSFCSVGVDSSIMGIGAAFATKELLRKNKLELKDIDLIEMNEAFAAQSIACIRELKVDEEKVNIHGGAIALGHPIGASGARILISLIYALRQYKKNLGLATLCIGGGQGISVLVEVKE